MKKMRICVSLPQDMMAHYKELAKASGISVSRLIYLRLRSKKPITLVGHDVLSAVNELKNLVTDIVNKNFLDEVTKQSIVNQTNFLIALVESDSNHVEKIKGR